MKNAVNTATKPSNSLPQRCGIRLTTSLRDHAASQPEGLSGYIRQLIANDMAQRGEVVNNAK